MQDSLVDLIESGKVDAASSTAITMSKEKMKAFFEKLGTVKDKIVLRPMEISNSPEVIRRLNVIAINTIIEADLYGNTNSSYVGGSRLMNGVGGSGDFCQNGGLSIFITKSTAKNGKISSIVPLVSHIDHTSKTVQVIVTEQGVADLRGKSPAQRAEIIIENCAHPDYKQLLWDYLKLSKMGQTRHNLTAAFAMHDTLARKGDMHLTDFAEYVK
jgi:acyl-CoA hydrolase